MKRYTQILLGSFMGVVLLLATVVMWGDIREFVFEERADEVPTVFLKMSPTLRAEVELYQRECFENTACDISSFILRRDEIIARDWPRVYDRLSRFENWGEGRLTVPYRDEFFLETQGFTPHKLRDEWVPVLQYREGYLVLYPCNKADRRRYVPKEVIKAGLCK